MKTYIVKFPCPTRGFFSIYLEAIRCIDFAVTNNLPFYVDLSEGNSLYSDEDRFNGNKNVWDYYYKQVKPEDGMRVYSVLKYEGNIDKIWKRSHFKRVHERAVKHLMYAEGLSEQLENRRNSFPSSTIGVHIRKTDHVEVPPVELNAYIDLLKKKIAVSNYKNIFLATDDHHVLDLIEKTFAERNVISNNVTRSVDGQGVHMNQAFSNRYQLGAEAILDAFTLSLCDETILTNSNLSYCSLYMNPEMKYSLLDGFNVSKLEMYFRNFFYEIRYSLYHNASFVKWHRKWRYFIKKFQNKKDV